MLNFEGNVGEGLIWPGFKKTCSCSKRDDGSWVCNCDGDQRGITDDNIIKCSSISNNDKSITCVWEHSYDLKSINAG